MYQPSEKILDKYADLMVNYACNKTRGVQKGQVVLLQVPEVAKPFMIALRRAVLKAGANPIMQMIPDDMSREYYELANKQQLTFFPARFMRGRIEEVDHSITVIADTDLHELDSVDPKKIMVSSQAFKPAMDWRNKKENEGKFTWTLALYGTEAMAKEAGMSLKAYWEQIIKACYLDKKDVVGEWRKMKKMVESVKNKLNSMNAVKYRIEAPGTDLIIGTGLNRKWLGGDGMNIPSYEVFITPDNRIGEGHVQFTEPLYRYGNLIKDVYLEFKGGRVVKARASKGEKILKEMIRTKGADRMGEFSLTDARLSRITKFMAETLFDENKGGRYGNTHIALGMGYKNSYRGNVAKTSKKKWEAMGFNDSVVHTDIVATSNRKVTAILGNGKEVVIYNNGKFVI